MRKAIVVLAGVAILVLVNVVVMQRERLLADGRVVFLELAPVDPRSLMQGDYMALAFKAAEDAFGRGRTERDDGRIVLKLDARGIGRFARFDEGGPLAPDEQRLRYRVREERPRFATNAYFFEEGSAARYAGARFGEFRVAENGEAILTGLRGRELEPLR